MAERLERLLTDLGERSLYDAASQCSRCGYCEQACPTYAATGMESKSPRGRNQIVRLMLEGKLDDSKAALESLETCLLCSGCTTACYAKVPVADIVLEGRRMLKGNTHWLVKVVSGSLVNRRWLLSLILKSGVVLKRIGLARLVRPLLSWVGLPVLASMDEHVDAVPFFNLDDLQSRRAKVENPSWRYFAPCGPRYLYPQVGTATLNAVDELIGSGEYLNNPCCGLLANNYGELEHARQLAKQNIQLSESNGDDKPIVGDCSSCVSFLKTYPQLFLRPEDADWKRRAEKYSRRIKDAIQIYGEQADKLPPGAAAGVETTYHDSCRAINGQGLKDEPRRAALRAAGESFCEMAGSDQCCGGAGAFAFVNEELSDQLLKTKVGSAAAVQAGVILTSSTSCLIQLARGLRKYYPEAKVLHLSEFVAASLEKPHGS